jgi:putative nucleotidyltransferase with HDIG domain
VISRTRIVGAAACLVLAVCALVLLRLEDAGNWDLRVFGLLLALVIVADLQDIHFRQISISGNFLGLVIAMALLGPAPAAVLGILSNTVWLVRTKNHRIGVAMMTVASYAAATVAGALVMREAGGALGTTPSDLDYIAAVAAGFVVAHVVNFVLVFGAMCFADASGASFFDRVRNVIIPLLPSDAAMVILAGLLIYAQRHVGTGALALLVLLFFLYLYLYHQLILSQERGEELVRRTEQLASLQVGVLTAMLRTLSMRDQMTARHSAAVARYARAIAKASGCTEEEQDLAHTAGLLHDIGKFILPDHILLADTKLNDDDWQLIRMHPYQGAKVVREVEGYGPIADIIWCHHERIDGRGYPRGLGEDEIPLISRMLSIADTYDVMTSRDSYRSPVSSAEAIAELRRVSGAQLDGRLVEVFIGVLETEDLAFQHTDDTDFEVELAFERRVRDYAAPRPAITSAAA